MTSEADKSDQEASDSAFERLELMSSYLIDVAKVYPANIYIAQLQGAVAERLGDDRHAAECYRRAVDNAPDEFGPRYRLAVVQLRLGDDVRAASHLLHDLRTRITFVFLPRQSLRVAMNTSHRTWPRTLPERYLALIKRYLERRRFFGHYLASSLQLPPLYRRWALRLVIDQRLDQANASPDRASDLLKRVESRRRRLENYRRLPIVGPRLLTSPEVERMLAVASESTLTKTLAASQDADLRKKLEQAKDDARQQAVTAASDEPLISEEAQSYATSRSAFAGQARRRASQVAIDAETTVPRSPESNRSSTADQSASSVAPHEAVKVAEPGSDTARRLLTLANDIEEAAKRGETANLPNYVYEVVSQLNGSEITRTLSAHAVVAAVHEAQPQAQHDESLPILIKLARLVTPASTTLRFVALHIHDRLLVRCDDSTDSGDVETLIAALIDLIDPNRTVDLGRSATAAELPMVFWNHPVSLDAGQPETAQLGLSTIYVPRGKLADWIAEEAGEDQGDVGRTDNHRTDEERVAAAAWKYAAAAAIGLNDGNIKSIEWLGEAAELLYAIRKYRTSPRLQPDAHAFNGWPALSIVGALAALALLASTHNQISIAFSSVGWRCVTRLAELLAEISEQQNGDVADPERRLGVIVRRAAAASTIPSDPSSTPYLSRIHVLLEGHFDQGPSTDQGLPTVNEFQEALVSLLNELLPHAQPMAVNSTDPEATSQTQTIATYVTALFSTDEQLHNGRQRALKEVEQCYSQWKRTRRPPPGEARSNYQKFVGDQALLNRLGLVEPMLLVDGWTKGRTWETLPSQIRKLAKNA